MTTAQKIADLDARIIAARQAQWNASQMNRAAGVFVTEDILTNLYRERDALAATGH